RPAPGRGGCLFQPRGPHQGGRGPPVRPAAGRVPEDQHRSRISHRGGVPPRRHDCGGGDELDRRPGQGPPGNGPAVSVPTPPFTRELELLEAGGLNLVAQLAESSNLTFVLEAARGGEYGWAVYKPERGERPLHDFAPGLHARERAAFLLSEHLG